jgi:ABC-type transport system involved in multi-copper enzyme maturation permease subunit
MDVFQSSSTSGKSIMPYSRPISRFYLTAPRVPTFAISIVLALFAVLIVYGHLTQLHGINGFVLLLVAYVVLLLGTLLRGV